MDLSSEPIGPPCECVHCDKRIVQQPGTDRWRSTEHGLAIDRMKCEAAPDRHHKPREATTEAPQHLPFNRVTLQWAGSWEPDFRTGDRS